MSNSNGCFQTGLRILAVLVGFTFIVTLPLAITGNSAAQVLFSPEVVSRVLSARLISSGAIERLIVNDLFDEWIASAGVESAEIEKAFIHLRPADRVELLQILLPDGWLESQVRNSVDGIYQWLDNQAAYPQVVLDLAPVKANLLGGGIEELVEILVDSWPSCSQEQLETMQAGVLQSGEVVIEFCEPPEPMRSVVVEFASVLLFEWISESPDSIVLNQDDPNTNELEELRDQIQSLRGLLQFSWFLSLVLLGLMIVLVVRSIRELFIWWGWPLLFGGITTIFFIGLLAISREGLLQSAVVDLQRDSTLAAQALRGTFDGVYSRILNASFVKGFLLSIVGSCMLGGGWYLSRRARRTPPQSPASIDLPISKPDVPSELSGIPEPPPVPPLEEDSDSEKPSGIFG